MPHRVVVSSLGPAFTFFLKLNGYCLFPGFNECPQRPVDPRLVAVSFFLEPGQHIRVQTKCDRFLQRLIELRQVVTEIMRAFPIVGGSLKPGDLATFGNSHVPFHFVCIRILMYRQYCKYKRSTWNTSTIVQAYAPG